MQKIFYFISLFVLLGCSKVSEPFNAQPPVAAPTKKDDSTACAYWKCSTTKQTYMQKYVKQPDSSYKPDGAYKLGEGIGAFPLEDLDKYKGGGQLGSSGG